jgi:hypothetical protein
MTAYIWHAGNGLDRASVCDSTILKNKRIFPNWLKWFISNLWRKIKGVIYEHRILYIYVIILEFILPHAYFLELLACCGADARVHPVPVPIVDRLHCPLPQLGPFIDNFTFFPLLLICLGCSRSKCRIQSPQSTCTYLSLHAFITSMDGNTDAHKHYMITTNWFAFIFESPDKLASNKSVRDS